MSDASFIKLMETNLKADLIEAIMISSRFHQLVSWLNYTNLQLHKSKLTIVSDFCRITGGWHASFAALGPTIKVPEIAMVNKGSSFLLLGAMVSH